MQKSVPKLTSNSYHNVLSNFRFPTATLKPVRKDLTLHERKGGGMHMKIL